MNGLSLLQVCCVCCLLLATRLRRSLPPHKPLRPMRKLPCARRSAPSCVATWQRKKPPGAIVGVSVHGRRYFFHYGKATDDGAQFTPDTLVEIGSNTKTFTTALFSLAVARGQMEEGESIQKHMPDGMKLEPLAQKATAIQLASFQSGMPDDPTNLPPKLEMRSIEHYTTKDFLIVGCTLEASGAAARTVQVFQFRHRAARLPGDECDRQDLGAAAQRRDRYAARNGRHGIAANSGTAAATSARTPDEWQGRARMAIFAWYAAGGLRSTARDMLRYGEANLGHSDVEGKPVPPALTSAMQKAQTPIYPLPAPAKAHQAMAWVVTDADPATGMASIVWKDGGTAGFSSGVVLHHGKDIAVFVAINEASQPAPGLGINIARHIP